MRNWPVVVTKRCADACAAQLGLSRSDSARTWLYKLIQQRGTVTRKPPASVPKLRSKSGYFLVAQGVAVLALVAASDGTARWIATDCKILPSYRKRFVPDEDADPFELTGADLVRQVRLSKPAVTQFQQYCDGTPSLDAAQRELIAVLNRDAVAVRQPPDWCPAPEADFYVVSGDEYVLPVVKRSSQPGFVAVGCLHRATTLFDLKGKALLDRCRLDPAANVDQRSWEAFTDATVRSGELSWRRPRWARPHPGARLWVVAGSTMVAPVTWRHDDHQQTLVVLDVQRRLPLVNRLRTVSLRPPERLKLRR